jgi:hypothetical protein
MNSQDQYTKVDRWRLVPVFTSWPNLKFSLRLLCVLCGEMMAKSLYRRDAENAEEAQSELGHHRFLNSNRRK